MDIYLGDALMFHTQIIEYVFEYITYVLQEVKMEMKIWKA